MVALVDVYSFQIVIKRLDKLCLFERTGKLHGTSGEVTLPYHHLTMIQQIAEQMLVFIDLFVDLEHLLLLFADSLLSVALLRHVDT